MGCGVVAKAALADDWRVLGHGPPPAYMASVAERFSRGIAGNATCQVAVGSPAPERPR